VSNTQKEIASNIVSNLMLTPINMEERVGELEARRLLAHLEHSKIPDSVCEDSVASIVGILDNEPWAKCNKTGMEVMQFINDQHKRWSKNGYRIIIEGGTERQRRRVMYFCMYRAIIARFSSWVYIARTYDWPTIIPVIGDWKHAQKHNTIEGMKNIKVLGLTEINLAQPRTNGDLEIILTSILRGRMLSGKPTIITLSRPSWLCPISTTCEINDLVNKCHDEEEEMIIRIRINEENL